jgi:hypothetical protein
VRFHGSLTVNTNAALESWLGERPQGGKGVVPLALQTDSWLSRLAEHSPDMRTKILAALSDELLRTGFVNGGFAAKLYNDLRPRALTSSRHGSFEIREQSD